ncbi:MAG: aldo/keto reductase [Chloroflexota bacterium]
MRYRRLGRTQLEVSEIGLGALEIGRDWGIRVGDDFGRPDEQQAIRLVHEAIDRGINFIDTAPAYQLSEERIGKALKGRRDDVYLATKVGEHYSDERGFWYDCGRDAVRASIEDSLRRLQTDTIDLLQIHSASPETIEQGETLAEMQRFQQAGHVRYIGISGDVDGALAAIDDGRYDTIQVPYSIVDQRMDGGVFESAKQHDIGVIIMIPLGQGIVTNKYQHSDKENERHKGDALQFLVRDGQTLAQAALRFVLANDAVSTVIAGTRKIENLRSNVEASGGVLTDAERTRIAELYSRNFGL